MKTWIKVLIGVGGTVFLLGIVLVVTLITKISWVILGIISILALIVWVIISTILVYNYLKRKKPITESLNIGESIKLAKYKVAYHEDNPDNFIVENAEVHRVGEPGTERTPILVIHGKGSEKNTKRVIIINSEDTKEITDLIDPTEEKINMMIMKMSKRQPEQEISETIPGGIDEFGRYTPAKVRTIRTTHSEIKKDEEKKEAEERTIY